MKISVTDTKANRSLSFDGIQFGGDKKAANELTRLVRMRRSLPSPNPHHAPFRATITGSAEQIINTMRHAVSPATPYASFIQVEVSQEELELTPATGSRSVNSRTMGQRNSGGVKSDASILYQHVPLTPETVDFKAGLFGSSNRGTQALQSIGSIALPGDMSEWRSPIRSRLYAAVTPGGGRDRDRRVPRLRCPAGFEFGGRFTGRAFGNCGRRLFGIPDDILGDGDGVARPDGDPANPFNTELVGTLKPISELVGAGKYSGRAAQISRNAQIPPVGARNDRSLYSAIERTSNLLDNNATDQIRLVRRDGIVLSPAVAISSLAIGGKRAPDMDGGVFVSVRKNPNNIGDAEIPVLLRSNLRGVSFAIPGGGSINMEKKRPLTTAERRRLARVWASSQKIDNYDFAAPMRRLAEQSDGAISYREKFPKKGHDELIGVTNGKRSMSVRRWVFEAFLEDRAPGSIGESWRENRLRPTDRSLDSTIGNLAEAVEHLDKGGDVRVVPSEFLADALQRSKVFRRDEVGDGVRLYTRGKEAFYEVGSKNDFEHLAHRVSSDLHEVLGMESPDVRFLGNPGKRRASLIEYPTGRLTEGAGYRRADPADLLRLATADFLLDQRERDPLTLATVRRNGKARLVASENSQAILAGLRGARRNQRQKLRIDEFYNEQRKKGLLERFSNLTDTQKQLLLGTFDDVLKQAADWSVDDYIAKLTIDGKLSPSERVHLEAMKTLYGERLKTLDANKTNFLSTIGLNS